MNKATLWLVVGAVVILSSLLLRRPRLPTGMPWRGQAASPERHSPRDGGSHLAADRVLTPDRKQAAEEVDHDAIEEKVSPEASKSAILVHVRTHDDLPLEGVVVELGDDDQNRPDRVGVTSALGDVLFSPVEPGRFRPLIVAASLPEGWIPSHKQDRCSNVQLPDFLGGRCIDVVKGCGRQEVTIRAFRAARVRGRVVGPLGEGIEGAFVRLLCLATGGSGLSLNALTDQDGSYTFDQVIPTLYGATVQPPRAMPYANMSMPRMIRVDVPGAEAIILPDLVLHNGGIGIVGQVVNQYGEPMKGISVLCYRPDEGLGDPMRIGRTQEDGTFQMVGLLSERIAVNVGLSGYACCEDVETLTPPQPTILDLRFRSEEWIDLGTIVLLEAEVYHIRGRVVLDGEREECGPEGVVLKIRFLEQPEMPSQSVDIDPSGRFSRTFRMFPGAISLDLYCFSPVERGEADGSRLLSSVATIPDVGEAEEVLIRYP